MPHLPTPSHIKGFVPKVLIGKAEPRQMQLKEVPAVLKGVKPAPAPIVSSGPIDNPEATKYQKMWDRPEYRMFAPGERVAHLFLEKAAPRPMDTVIDFGAGTGRGALHLALFGTMHVTMVDFADNCLDPEIKEMLTTQAHMMRFVLADLEKEIPVSAKYGLCTDVMEHIPTDKVDIVLHNILKSAEHVFFQISCVDDCCGKLIGETLHMTVKPFEWWLEKMKYHDATIHWSDKGSGDALFYVSSWNDAREIVKFGEVNTADKVIEDNIKSCIARKLTQVHPHQAQDDKIITVLGGGPTLAGYWDEIKEKWDQGQKIVTTNGTYNECIARGILPSAQIVTDARGFNIRFVQPVINNCKYLLASQCHPSLFDAIPSNQIFVWHTPLTDEMSDIVTKELSAIGEQWFPIPGGSTVMLRGITLLKILGFSRMEIYGFDSCLSEEGKHHAYEQKENDNEKTIVKVTCGGRVFLCHPWMASQAQEFLDQMKHLLVDEVELLVHGDGLIAHILQTGANEALAQEF